MAQIHVEITEKELETLVRDQIAEIVGHDVPQGDIKILVKSKQNYRAEWELANFKATYDAVV